jgi:hypothetical protein
VEQVTMTSDYDAYQTLRRRLSALQSDLERHDRHYAARHTRESTALRTDLVRQIQALEQQLREDGQDA